MRAPTLLPQIAQASRKSGAARARMHATPQALPITLPVLPKLKFGARHDAAERDADRVAEQVLAKEPTALDILSAPPQVAAAPPLPPPGNAQDIGSRILRALRFGRPLPERARADMEARFGADFSSVRIHTHADAAAASDDIQAHAFAVGEHIAFAEGAFRPDSDTGRHLLAHELAHVVQARDAGGSAETAVHRQTREPGTLTSWVNAAGDFLADQGWAMVRAVAPPIVVEFLQARPMKWLQNKLGKAFDAVVASVTRRVPLNALDDLGVQFGGLLDRASAILAGLAAGDCQPLFDAIGALKNFVGDVAGRAWQRLGDFLEPVGNFFSDLWTGYGAPALKWLEDFGGRAWDEITGFARRLWDDTRRIRDAAGGAWAWFKEQLFGRDDAGDGSSGEGLFGWVMRKAGEAWDWVKQQTRPVWQPVAAAVEFVQRRPLLPFLDRLSQQMTQLSGDLQNTAGQMEANAGGRPVAENRQALAAALPSIQQIIARVRATLVGAGQWLLDQLGALGGGVVDFMGRLRANPVLSALAGALGWLESAARRLVGWCGDKVMGLFNTLVSGFDTLTPFFEKILTTVRRVISVVGDLMQLPILVMQDLWKRIPACIREPITNFLIQQILGRIPVFGQLFTNPELWARVQQTALEILRQVFVDGNLARAAWTFFQAMLRVLGLPPELMVRVLAKAAQAIGDVLRDPIGFLGNLLRAMRAGFGLFFSNIGTHLFGGFTGWLFGHLSAAGIQPPADFSLRSVLGFAMQVFGVTVENVFQRLSERVGAGVVERLRKMLDVATGVWGFVRILVEEGPAGLWKEIQQRLSNLWDTLVDGAIAWLTDKVIARATQWLMSLLDVTGIMPIINTLVAVYNAIESFVQYLREILEMVSRVLDGVIGIAAGQIDQAAGFLERAMADGLPVAIGFLANQFGLGDIGRRLQELIAPVRQRVDAAIDWLIDRAIGLGQGVLAMVRSGVGAVKGAVAKVRDWWRQRFGFRGPRGEQHHVYFEGQGAQVEVMVASEPQTLSQFIRHYKDNEALRNQYREVLRLAREAKPGEEPDRSGEVVAAANTLAAMCAQLMAEKDTGASTPPVYGRLQDGFGTEVFVERLTATRAPGSSPSVSGGRWDTLLRRRNGKNSYYVRGHLLNELLGGPGNTWANLVPLTGSTNARMSANFETPIKQAIAGGAVVRLRVGTSGDGHALPDAVIADLRAEDADDSDRLVASIMEAERCVPKTVNLDANVEGGTQAWKFAIANDIDINPERYDPDGKARRSDPVYLSHAGVDALGQLPGVDTTLAERIVKRARDGIYRTRADFHRRTETQDALWRGFAQSNHRVRLYKRSAGGA